MKFQTAFAFYKSNRAIARAAEVSDQAVSLWKAKGIVPLKSANLLQVRSHGKVKVESAVYVEARNA
jgi:hypothetical protein